MPNLALKNFLGLNNVMDSDNLPPNYFIKADNVEITDDFCIKVRKPIEALSNSPDNCHSLFPFRGYLYFRAGAGIYRMNRYSKDVELLYADDALNNSLRMYYKSVLDRIYMMDGNIGIVHDVSAGYFFKYGLPIPNRPSLKVEYNIGGSIKKGKYRFKITFIREDGVESGTSPYNEIEVKEDNATISLKVNIPEDFNIGWFSVYATDTDEGTFRLVGTYLASYEVIKYNVLKIGKAMCMTEGLKPMPIGTAFEFFAGSMWVAEANVLYFSELFSYEITDKSRNFIQFQDFINDLYIVGDLLIVCCSDGTYSINLDKKVYKLSSEVIFKGSGKVIDLAKIGFFETPMTGVGLLASSKNGIILITSGGNVMNLTEKSYRFNSGNIAVSCMDGSKYLINILS